MIVFRIFNSILFAKNRGLILGLCIGDGCLLVASTKFAFMNLTFVHTALFVEIVD